MCDVVEFLLAFFVEAGVGLSRKQFATSSLLLTSRLAAVEFELILFGMEIIIPGDSEVYGHANSYLPFVVFWRNL
jgi:hypothetical protein